MSSWRYGRSLGIDITHPPKKCTYNCIYCQLGTTKRHVGTPEEIMDSIPSTENIITDVRDTLQKIDQQTIDVITISGTGEPTLNLNLGSIIASVKKIAPKIPIVLLTNASLLPRNDVRKGILDIDFVTAKLDAGDEDTFKRINHPIRGLFHLDVICSSIKKLSREMKGVMALEVMLLKGPSGLTNVEGASRKALIDRIVDVNPDIVQIYTPWRPTAVSKVEYVSDASLRMFANDLREYFDGDRLWVYGVHDARGKSVKWKTHQTLEKEIVELLRRRPCRIADISISLGILSSVTTTILGKLESSGKIRAKLVSTDVFYEINN